MAPSKSTRILILLVVDTCFFFLELIAGYAVHSLALVADSFHMLNDIISLLVGLWAVKVAASDTDSKMYTYGWQRAETLGALVNGVFLIALCLSIFLEAIQRFVEPQVVTQPKIIFVVGCMGLLSNILGLLLFHDHGHSHGGGEDHSHEDPSSIAENGHVSHEDEETANIASDSGNIAGVLPQSIVGSYSGKKVTHSHGTHGSPEDSKKDSETSDLKHTTTSSSFGRQTSGNSPSQQNHRRQGSSSHPRYSSLPEVPHPGHPAAMRSEFIARSSEIERDEEQESDSIAEDAPLLSDGNGKGYGAGIAGDNKKSLPADFKHDHHKHRGPKASAESHGHSHGDLNMRGVFLHVMGDALGNIGVIATALFIWGTDFSWRFYSDPAISLVITVIILCSAIPLCKAAARILLQAVPAGVSIDEIKEDIEQLPGVISCHHIHVWQLSDTKLVASLHVMLAFDFEGEGKQEFMRLTSAIRTCLREYGIRNPTIQAEFCLDENHSHQLDGTITPKSSDGSQINIAAHGDSNACVWESGARGETCCPAESRKT